MAPLDEKPETLEAVAALVRAQEALDDAVAQVVADTGKDGGVSRVGIAKLRDAADQVRRAVPAVGKLRSRK